MKKILLLFVFCLMAVNVASASQWVSVDTESNKLLLFVDKEAIVYEKPDISYFPLLVKEQNKTPKVFFMKVDYSNNTGNIIREDDYDINHYNPMYIYSLYQVYMKPIIKNTVIDLGYRYVACEYTDSTAAQNICGSVLPSNSSNRRINKKYDNVNINDASTYILKQSVLHNWKVPAKGKNKDGIVFIVIGKKGSLSGYNIIKSAGNETADRAMISAIELTAPFQNIENTTMRLNFHSKLIKKSID